MADRQDIQKDTQGAGAQFGTATIEQGRSGRQDVSRRGQSGSLQGSAAREPQAMTRFRDPFTTMQRLSEEMDELFDAFFYGRPRARGGRQTGLQSLWAPEIELCEEDNRLRVLVDLPGVPKDKVKIDVEDGMLTIQGERREESTEGGAQEGYRRTERRYGSFYRSVPLPEGADASKAEARMKDGVLEVSVPMAPRKQAKRLEIQG